jgi:hypothetical protein
MGYNVDIVRRINWDDLEEDSQISLEEWLAYVQTDPELELTNGYFIERPGHKPVFEASPGYCIWKGHPSAIADNSAWLTYWYGSVGAKNPDQEIIQKMIAIAPLLRGRVQGEEGEFYE